MIILLARRTGRSCVGHRAVSCLLASMSTRAASNSVMLAASTTACSPFCFGITVDVMSLTSRPPLPTVYARSDAVSQRCRKERHDGRENTNELRQALPPTGT
jgi:hypothetical protein